MSVRPPLLAGLTDAAAEVSTMRGKAAVAWHRDAQLFELRVEVPVGAEATVHFPLVEGTGMIEESGALVWRDGAAAGEEPAVAFLKNDGGYAVFRMGSGVYAFRGGSFA
jgi:hypothetical protein